MNKFLTLSLFVPLLSAAQIQINESFSDGDFHSNPPWLGDTADFVVNSAQSLQLSAAQAGTAHIFTGSRVIENAQWEFELMLDFNPSAANFLRVYLCSDTVGEGDGYFLQIGGSAEDRMSLFRQSGNNLKLLWQSAEDFVDQSPLQLRLQLRRDSAQHWQILGDTGSFPNPLQWFGSAVDSAEISSRYFGFACFFTATRADKFHFDNISISGEAWRDTHPPRVDTIYALDKNRILLGLNEPLHSLLTDSSDFYVPGHGYPKTLQHRSAPSPALILSFVKAFENPSSQQLQISKLSDTAANVSSGNFDFFIEDSLPVINSYRVPDSLSVRIDFSEAMQKSASEDIANYMLWPGGQLPLAAKLDSGGQSLVLQFHPALEDNRSYILEIAGLTDFFGNILSDSLHFSIFTKGRGSLIINEIMADPSPVAGLFPHALPECEYLELYNPNEFTVLLEGYRLICGSREYILPFSRIGPHHYLLLCAESCAPEFSPELLKLALPWSSAILPNDGAELRLISAEGGVLEKLHYDPDFHTDANKAEGGWSLERVNPYDHCPGAGQWVSSESPMGGSPAAQNSVYNEIPDSIPPRLQRINLLSTQSISLHFSKSMDSLYLLNSDHFALHQNLTVAGIRREDLDGRVYRLDFAQPMLPDQLYWLHFDSLYACDGTAWRGDTLFFGLPSLPGPGDIVINEILFNPLAGGADFVEIYNQSEKAFDLSKLYLANQPGEQPHNVVPLAEEAELWLPQTYRAYSEDVDYLRAQYLPPEDAALREIESLPTMADKDGSIAILDHQLKSLEVLRYDEDWHLPFLEDTEGISLERINPDGAMEASNWTSASYTVNYGSPGYANSQQWRPASPDRFSVAPQLFFPERERLNLAYNLAGENNVLSISIWTIDGNPVKNIISRKNVAREGVESWDGTNTAGQLMQPGIYIVLFEFYGENSAEKRIVKSCVVSL